MRSHTLNHPGLAVLITLWSVSAYAGQPPTPAAQGAASPQMVRAAGMPLQDGALPPGALTVRVVQGAFAGDLTGLVVEVTIDGLAPRRMPTGVMGRAEFAHLPIGARVRASAVVNGERLSSETFPMPADSGVRVLLVTGGAEGAAGAHAAGAPARSTGAVAPAEAAPASHFYNDSATIVRFSLVSLTILAFGWVGARQWRRRGRRSDGPPTILHTR